MRNNREVKLLADVNYRFFAKQYTRNIARRLRYYSWRNKIRVSDAGVAATISNLASRLVEPPSRASVKLLINELIVCLIIIANLKTIETCLEEKGSLASGYTKKPAFAGISMTVWSQTVLTDSLSHVYRDAQPGLLRGPGTRYFLQYWSHGHQCAQCFSP